MDVLTQWGPAYRLGERVETGATNETWKVSNGSTVSFLRRYRTTDGDAVEREHRLIKRVAAAGVDTPKAIPSGDGETLVDADGALYALFQAARGRQLESSALSPRHAAAAGAFLAKLHIATAGVPVDGFRSWSLDWNGASWADRVRSTAAQIPRTSPSEIDRWAYRRSNEQAEWLDDPACTHSYVAAFPAQLIHGDYQQANLFFDGQAVSAVIDWDSAVVMCRAFEVVRACAFMFQLHGERTRAFLAAYRRVSPLSSAELLDGAGAWGCFSDHHVWPTEERYLRANLAAERFIPQQPFRPFAEAWQDLGVT